MASRALPINQDAEMATLGSMLLDNNMSDEVLDMLRREDFYWDKHRVVFDAISELRTQATPVDLVTITDYLRQNGTLNELGGATFISSLASSVPTAANGIYYAKIIAELSVRRQAIAKCTEIIQAAYEGEEDIADMMQAAALEIDRRTVGGEPVSFAETMRRVADRLEYAQEHKGELMGITTGLQDLDDITGGLQPGELVILGGRPSMGKSALAQCIMESAGTAGHTVLHALLEDTLVNIGMRSISRATRIDLQSLRRAWFGDYGWDRISQAFGKLAPLPIWTLEPPYITVGNLRRTARKLKAEQDLKLIVVDYLQIMPPVRPRENRYLEIGEISVALKRLAQELDVPVLALAQLKRDSAGRRPTMADIRESGDIEQNADVILLLHREEYYRPDTDRKGIAEIIIGKQRNGPTGSIDVYYDRVNTAFRDLANEEVAS
ncbi:MAG TPA: replicative DNA helicase [Bacillota bacterium]|nr:replicative DNA helicase [Bacillota bacterium]